MTFLQKFYLAITNTSIEFIQTNPHTQKLLIAYIGEIQDEIKKSQKNGASTHRYFDLLEEITHQLIKIHGFPAFRAVYGEEDSWIKTEIKNTLNFSLWDAAEE